MACAVRLRCSPCRGPAAESSCDVLTPRTRARRTQGRRTPAPAGRPLPRGLRTASRASRSGHHSHARTRRRQARAMLPQNGLPTPAFLRSACAVRDDARAPEGRFDCFCDAAKIPSCEPRGSICSRGSARRAPSGSSPASASGLHFSAGSASSHPLPGHYRSLGGGSDPGLYTDQGGEGCTRPEDSHAGSPPSRRPVRAAAEGSRASSRTSNAGQLPAHRAMSWRRPVGTGGSDGAPDALVGDRLSACPGRACARADCGGERADSGGHRGPGRQGDRRPMHLPPVLGHIEGSEINMTFTDSDGNPVKLPRLSGEHADVDQPRQRQVDHLRRDRVAQLRAEPDGSATATVTGHGVWLGHPAHRQLPGTRPAG